MTWAVGGGGMGRPRGLKNKLDGELVSTLNLSTFLEFLTLADSHQLKSRVVVGWDNCSPPAGYFLTFSGKRKCKEVHNYFGWQFLCQFLPKKSVNQ